jgi:hypothetical protein
VLAFALAAFALVPQALSSSYLNTERFYGAAAGNFRPSANTLFSGGFGVWNLNTHFSLVVVVTAALGVAAFLALGQAERRRRGSRVALTAAIVSVIAASGPAGPIWDALPVLSKLQFPWRLSAILTLIATVMVARLAPRRAWVFVLVTVAVAVPFAGWNRTAPAAAYLPSQPPAVAAGTVFPDPHTAWQAGSGGWYWRHDALVEPWLLANAQPPFLLADLAGRPATELDRIRHRPAIVSGQDDAVVTVVRWGQVERALETTIPNDSDLVWRIIPFPEMEITVDGRLVDSAPDPRSGLLSHPVAAGSHRVVWRWRPFPVLRAARVVTMSAVIGTLALMALALFGHRKRSRP